MPRSWKSICSVVGLMLLSATAASAADSVSGSLQIGAERFDLKCVFAVMEQDGVAANSERLTVFLSDSPVPDELRKASDDWVYWADKQARAGALHGVTLAINPTTGVWDSGRLLTRNGINFYTDSASSADLRDLRIALAGPIGAEAAGKVSMKEPLKTIDDGTWRVEAEFHSAVIRRPAVTGVLTGAAALNSPQYKAVAAFLNACRKKDLEAIQNSVDPPSRKSLAEMIASNKEQALEMFANMAGETAALKLTKVTVRGDSAELEFGDGKPGSESKESLRVVLFNGEWKLAQ